MSTHIRTARDEGILTLTLNRPDKRNAITDEMYDSLASAVEAAQCDDGVRAIIIRGQGPFFTAGNYLSDFAAADSVAEGPRNVWRFIRSLAANRKPLVAAAQGRAVRIGTTMLLHCDHVVLAEDTVLTTPFVNLAWFPKPPPACCSRLVSAMSVRFRCWRSASRCRPAML
jgi:enoyl-CoA hydratase/carnithine racemase